MLLTEAREQAVSFWKQRTFRRDFLIAVSLANFCYLRIWSELLTYRRADTYTMKSSPLPAEFMAIVLNVLLMAGVLLFAITAARRRHGGRSPAFARWAFLIFLILPLNALRSVLSNKYTYLKSPLFAIIGQNGVVILTVTLVIAGLVTIAHFGRKLAHILAVFFMITAPFTLITFSQAVWKAARYDPAVFADKPTAPKLPAKSGPRVLWVIFDEWDYRLTFVDRDATVHLPELDRFRAEAFFATQAQRPGPETPISIPALTTGRAVDGVVFVDGSTSSLKFAGRGDYVPWGAQPNVFGRARQAGFNTSVTGWYHPYCRILNESVTDCKWWAMAMQYNSMGARMGERLAEILPNQTRSLFETSLLSVFGQSLSVKEHVRTYRAMLDRAKRVASDPDYGLVYVHMPVPHGPHAFNRFTGKFNLKNAPIKGYLDSLLLVDHSVAELRRSMEAAGSWDKTTILLSADHGYRESWALDGHPTEQRVPFLLKMAGQHDPVTYDAPFSALQTQDLLLAILRGEITAPEGIPQRLSGANSSTAPAR